MTVSERDNRAFQVQSFWNSDAHLSTHCLFKIPKNQHASALRSNVKIQKLRFTSLCLSCHKHYSQAPETAGENCLLTYASIRNTLKFTPNTSKPLTETQGLYRGTNIQIFPGALTVFSPHMLFIKQETHNAFIQTEENHSISVPGGTRLSLFLVTKVSSHSRWCWNLPDKIYKWSCGCTAKMPACSSWAKITAVQQEKHVGRQHFIGQTEQLAVVV